MSKDLIFNFPTDNVVRVEGYFFLTDVGESVVNGTVTITIIDDSSFTDVVNATSGTLTVIERSGGISGIVVSTSGSDYPTAREVTVYNTLASTDPPPPPPPPSSSDEQPPPQPPAEPPDEDTGGPEIIIVDGWNDPRLVEAMARCCCGDSSSSQQGGGIGNNLCCGCIFPSDISWPDTLIATVNASCIGTHIITLNKFTEDNDDGCKKPHYSGLLNGAPGEFFASCRSCVNNVLIGVESFVEWSLEVSLRCLKCTTGSTPVTSLGHFWALAVAFRSFTGGIYKEVANSSCPPTFAGIGWAVQPESCSPLIFHQEYPVNCVNDFECYEDCNSPRYTIDGDQAVTPCANCVGSTLTVDISE